MKLCILIAASTAALFGLWLIGALILARLRGWQLSRDIREMEGREFNNSDLAASERRVVAVKWEDSI